MVEPQSSVHAGRAKILEPDEKIDGGEETLEDLMAKIEAIPSNVRLLKQIGVRESVKRVSCSSQRQMVGMLHPLAPLRARVPMDTQRSLRLARRVFFYAPSPLALTIPRACLSCCASSVSVPWPAIWQNTKWKIRGYSPSSPRSWAGK